MLKSLFRYATLNKVENGIILSFSRKMQDQNYQKNHNESHNRNQVERHDNILKREWVTVAKEPNKHGLAFTILNYNILSQKLLEMHEYLYRDHSWQALKWHQRFSNLVGEILHNNPDILCCQEVQLSHLQDIQGRLRSMNYDVVYKKRTGDKPDGCAIFYKRHLFNLIEHHKVEFEQPQLNSELLDRENVAVVCKFALKSDPSVKFLVATTHLLYNPKRQDIRLAQIQILLAELDRISKVRVEGNKNTHLPIILSGDFNLQPHSAPYNLIVDGIVKYENLSRRTLLAEGKANSPANGRSLLPIKLGITDECQHMSQSEIKLYHSESNKAKFQNDIELTKEIVNLFQTGVLRHNFDFMSTYQNPERFVSTHQDRWVLVDYMFYSNGTKNQTERTAELNLIAFLALPSAHNCENINLRIPNSYLGSDHLSLASRFFLSSPLTNQPSTSTKL